MKGQGQLGDNVYADAHRTSTVTLVFLRGKGAKRKERGHLFGEKQHVCWVLTRQKKKNKNQKELDSRPNSTRPLT